MANANDKQSDTVMSTMARLPASTNDSAIDDNLVFISSDLEAEERGRLKRRRKSSHSPRRASSPSRGHDRTSGSRYRLHHRKHHRPSSPSSSVSPPTIAQKKHRRRSDAELDHTFRGRVRNRGATLEEGVDEDEAEGREDIRERKRSAPPSRNREEGVDGEGMRRQRSYPNLYKEERRDSKITDEESLAPTDSVIVDGVVPVVQGA